MPKVLCRMAIATAKIELRIDLNKTKLFLSYPDTDKILTFTIKPPFEKFLNILNLLSISQAKDEILPAAPLWYRPK